MMNTTIWCLQPRTCVVKLEVLLVATIFLPLNFTNVSNIGKYAFTSGVFQILACGGILHEINGRLTFKSIFKLENFAIPTKISCI